MAVPLSASQLISALHAEGLGTVEYPGWRTHSRNHKGEWGPVHGVMIHHTVTLGTDASVRLCHDGHTTLPGPLCHAVGPKDGRLFMVGHGRANHAGLGDGRVLADVIKEEPLRRPRVADTDGNQHFYGVELINLGDGHDPWPEEQVDAAARWAAALCRAHGWSERSVIGHKEWQPGKIDPSFDMDAFRGRVRRLLNREEEEMALTEEDLNRIAERVWTRDFLTVSWGTEQNPRWPASAIAHHATEVSRETRGRVKALQSAVAELVARNAAHEAVLTRLAEGGNLDEAQLRAVAEAGAQAALDRLSAALDKEE